MQKPSPLFLSLQKWLARALPRSIRARLLLLIALAMLPLLLIQFLIFEQRYETRRFDEMQTELEVARGAANSFSAYIRAIDQQNFAVGAAILGEHPLEPAEATHLLSRAAAYFSMIRNLSWTDPQGVVLASSLPDLVGRDLSTRSYFPAILAGESFSMGLLTQTGLVTNAPTLVIATGIRDARNQLAGVIVAVIEPARLGELTLAYDRPGGGQFSLFDRQGAIVYVNPVSPLTWEDRTQWINQDTLLQRALQTGQETFGITTLPNLPGEWIVARVPNLKIGFVAGARRPVSAALEPLLQILIRDIFLTLLAGLLVFLIVSLIAHSIASPLSRLERDALEMGAGNIPQAADRPLDSTEVQHLRRTVEKMAADLLERAAVLQESERRYRVLFENLHTPMLVIDPATSAILDANPAACLYYGWPHDQFTQKKITEINLLPPGQTRNEMEQAKIQATSQHFEFKHRLSNGEVRDVEVHSGPIEIGEKTYLFSIIHDISARKRLEAEREQVQQSLAVEHRRLVDTLESIQDGFMEINWGWQFTYLNQRAAQGAGVDPEFLVGKSIWETYPALLGTQIEALYRRVMAERQPETMESAGVYTKTWYEIRVYPSLQGITIFWSDISSRKQVEESLRASEERFYKAFHASPDAQVISQVEDGLILEVNESYEKLFGFDRSEAVGKTSLELGMYHHVEDRQEAVRRLREEKSVRNFELEIQTKDGRIRQASLSSELFSTGAGAQMLTIIEDITEQKKAETALAEYTEKLRLSNQELEQFAFVASHDLQEPLRKIIYFGESISKRVDESLDEESLDALSRMQNAAKRMRDMIQDLLLLSRVSTRGEAFQEVDLSQVAEEAISDLEGRIRRDNGQVLVGDLPTIQADRSQMHRLLQNLIGNALKYHQKDTPPVVKISGRVDMNGGSPAPVATLTIEDNGIGFDEQFRDRIFEPFQRLHGRSEYEGTGMGLTICKKIVDRHHGAITARSQPGQGTVFTIQLPVRQPE